MGQICGAGGGAAGRQAAADQPRCDHVLGRGGDGRAGRPCDRLRPRLVSQQEPDHPAGDRHGGGRGYPADVQQGGRVRRQRVLAAGEDHAGLAGRDARRHPDRDPRDLQRGDGQAVSVPRGGRPPAGGGAADRADQGVPQARGQSGGLRHHMGAGTGIGRGQHRGPVQRGRDRRRGQRQGVHRRAGVQR